MSYDTNEVIKDIIIVLVLRFGKNCKICKRNKILNVKSNKIIA